MGKEVVVLYFKEPQCKLCRLWFQPLVELSCLHYDRQIMKSY